MKVTVKSERLVSIDNLIEIVCNSCSKHINVKEQTENYQSFNVKWAYFSKKDFEQHTFDLCETCYDKIVSTFMIPVEVSEYNLWGHE